MSELTVSPSSYCALPLTSKYTLPMTLNITYCEPCASVAVPLTIARMFSTMPVTSVNSALSFWEMRVTVGSAKLALRPAPSPRSTVTPLSVGAWRPSSSSLLPLSCGWSLRVRLASSPKSRSSTVISSPMSWLNTRDSTSLPSIALRLSPPLKRLPPTPVTAVCRDTLLIMALTSPRMTLVVLLSATGVSPSAVIASEEPAASSLADSASMSHITSRAILEPPNVVRSI